MKKTRLILKFMTSQPIYCPISHKDNETMKFGELIKH